MNGADDYHYGASVTTRALQEIIERSGFKWEQKQKKRQRYLPTWRETSLT
ncbi:hypothetical protein [Desulforamulus putei]